MKMLNKRQIKSLANRIEKAKMNIAKQRDILRDLLSEVDEIREHCDEAYDDLDRAIDGLSRLL
jgi:predicted  nucleic acid-binding Zn-ribbon protein